MIFRSSFYTMIYVWCHNTICSLISPIESFRPIQSNCKCFTYHIYYLHSMASIELYDHHINHFGAMSNCFQDINAYRLNLAHWVQGHGIQLSLLCHSMASIEHTKCYTGQFWAGLHRFQDINVSIVWHEICQSCMMI